MTSSSTVTGCDSQPGGTGSAVPLVLTSRWVCAAARRACTTVSRLAYSSASAVGPVSTR